MLKTDKWKICTTIQHILAKPAITTPTIFLVLRIPSMSRPARQKASRPGVPSACLQTNICSNCNSDFQTKAKQLLEKYMNMVNIGITLDTDAQQHLKNYTLEPQWEDKYFV